MFKKKVKLTEIAKEYIEIVKNTVENCSDENKLNLMFTEITILRIELDKFDSWISNIKDAKKRKENINKKDLINNQFYDICDSYSSYNDDNKKKIDNVMSKILPAKGNKSIWNYIKEYFNNATGKH